MPPESAVLVLTYCIYPTLSVKIFSTFNCGTAEYADGMTHYLHADYSIECDNATQRDYMVFAGFMVLCISVGTPVLYLVLLNKSHGKTEHISNLRFLYQDYTAECWCVCLL